MTGMTEHSKETGNDGYERRVGNRRRRNTDNPQPLDYVTREQVREIVENRQPTTIPAKFFIQKILKVD